MKSIPTKLMAFALFHLFLTHGIAAQSPKQHPSNFESPALRSPSAAGTDLFKKEHLFFIENKGQWSKEVLYLARIGGADVWITTKGVVYDFYKVREKTGAAAKKQTGPVIKKTDPGQPGNFERYGQVVNMTLENADLQFRAEGREMSKGYYNYLRGKDRSKWADHVGLYQEVLVKGIYKGIDVRYYFEQGLIRYDYIVQPGADVSNIRMSFDGMDKIYLNGKDELVMMTRFGEVKQLGLQAYQEKNAGKQLISSRFLQDNKGIIFFNVGNYDKTQPLIIDPLVYSTFIGGADSESSSSMAIDGSGNAFITGATASPDYPATPGSYDQVYASSYYWDAFITKLNNNGSDLIYSTFIGGDYDDAASSIVIDETGNAYITGLTGSLNFPTTPGVFDETANGEWICDPEGYQCYRSDVFVLKLNSNGSALIYSTLMGGAADQSGSSIAIDAAHNAYITGYTGSADFPVTPGSYDETMNGSGDVFVSKLNSTGSALLYSTFIGGENYECGQSLAIDVNGNACLTGLTQSTGFPSTPGAFDQTFNGSYDVFVVKLNSTGSALLYSTFIGGIYYETAYSLVLDAPGNAYITGYTYSSGYPVTTGAYDISFNGNEDVFVTKLNSSGSALLYSTFIGGITGDIGFAIALDGNDQACVTGYIYAPDNYSNFPVTPDAIDPDFNNGNYDAFVSVLNSTGSELRYSTFLGGNNYDMGRDLKSDGSGHIYVTGYTFSPDFPASQMAFDASYNGMWDIFVTKLEITSNHSFSFSPSSNSPVCAGNTLYLTVFPTGGSAPYTYSWTGPNGFSSAIQNPSITSATTAATGMYSVTVTDAGGNSGSATTDVIINALPVAAISASAPSCSTGCVELTASGGITYYWSTGSTGTSITACNDGTYEVTAVSAGGCTDRESFRVYKYYPNTAASISASVPACGSGCITLTASEGVSYRWSTGSTSRSITPCTAGNFQVTVTNAYGCTATAQTTLTTPESSCPVPANPGASITSINGVRLYWTGNDCAISYQVQYRLVGTVAWTVKNTNSNTWYMDLKGLKRSATYEGQVRSKCSSGGVDLYSAFTPLFVFSLSSGGVASKSLADAGREEGQPISPALAIWPNPAAAQVNVTVSGLEGLWQLRVIDMTGRHIMSQTISLKGRQTFSIPAANLPGGVYTLILQNSTRTITGSFVKK